MSHRARVAVNSAMFLTSALARAVLTAVQSIPRGKGWTQHPEDAVRRPRETSMHMDIWYELALREFSDVDETTTELRREAESLQATTDEPDEEDE